VTLELILILTLFCIFILGTLTSTPVKTFTDYSPRLGARIEKQLVTGDGFTTGGKGPKWVK
jgi:hypothetical protein